MKKETLLYSALAFFVLLILFRGRIKSIFKPTQVTAVLPPAPPAPAAAQGGTQPPAGQLFNAAEGLGLQAVNARMKQVFESPSRRAAALNQSGASNVLYRGMRYTDDMKAAMTTIFGAANSVPIAPRELEPGYNDRLESWQSLPGFERTTAANGIQKAFELWRPAFKFEALGVDFWPAQLPALIEAGAFPASGNSDRNRSERYDAFTRDAVVLGKNIIVAGKLLADSLKEQAIQDLRASGWRFIGYDTPQTATP